MKEEEKRKGNGKRKKAVEGKRRRVRIRTVARPWS
jgi:hypothetical protein